MKKITIWESIDGKQFKTEHECMLYETEDRLLNMLLELIDNYNGQNGLQEAAFIGRFKELFTLGIRELKNTKGENK